MKIRLTKQLNEQWQIAADALRLSKADYLRRALRSWTKAANVAECKKREPATLPETVVTVDDVCANCHAAKCALRWAVAKTLAALPAALKVDPVEMAMPYEVVEEL